MKFKVKKANGGYKADIPANANGEDTKDLCYAVAAYGFLIPWNGSANGPEFAALIRQHYRTTQAEILAKTLERS
jgi:hypothetical protein